MGVGGGLRATASAALLGGLAAAWGSGCGANQHAGEGFVWADTARGIVEVAGAEPLTLLVLRTPDGDIRLAGEAAESLRRASGAEVWVAGRRAEDGSLEVDAYRIRAVDGLEAVDGRLEVDGVAAVVVTDDGDRVRYESAPPALRALTGQRVWVAGPPGEEPRSWGVLEPAP